MELSMNSKKSEKFEFRHREPSKKIEISTGLKNWRKMELGIEKEKIVSEGKLHHLTPRVERKIDHEIQKKEYLRVRR